MCRYLIHISSLGALAFIVRNVKSNINSLFLLYYYHCLNTLMTNTFSLFLINNRTPILEIRLYIGNLQSQIIQVIIVSMFYT